jgi:hypothetical protein
VQYDEPGAVIKTIYGADPGDGKSGGAGGA